MNNSVGMLADVRPPVSRATTCREVFELFMLDPDALCVAVVDNGEVFGLVNRQDFILRYTYQFGPDLYGRMSITKLMDPRPLVVDERLPHERVGEIIADTRPAALLRGFIVTRNDRYLGVGTSLGLLRMMLQLTQHRAEELDFQRKRAEEANASKTNFLASMSHELRTPLNAIIGFTDFMLTQPFGPLAERYREYAGDVHSSAEHLLHLINELLDMSKIEAGRMNLIEDVVAVDDILAESARMVLPDLTKAGLELDVEIEARLPKLRGDSRMLRQILLNLLSNAVKFTPEGGRITLSAERRPGGLNFIVSDTGIGIPAEHQEKILEPFEQVENPLSRSRPGTGLGLPLVKAMTEAHGGIFRLESEVGVGTIVTATFPGSRLVEDELVGEKISAA